MDHQDITPESLKHFAMADENGRILLHIGLLVTLYIENAHEDEKRKGLLQCFDDYWNLCGDRLCWASMPQVSKKWIDLRKGGVKPLNDWVPGLSENHPWSVSMTGSGERNDASAYNIEIYSRGQWQKKLSYVTATLPFVWFTENDGSLVDLVRRWSEWTLPYHGYAGLGIVSSMETLAAQKAEPQVYAIASRHPGLEVDIPVNQAGYLQDGIKGVNWLTVLNRKWTSAAGGRDRFSGRLSQEFIYHDYRDGVIIQAGAHPQLGDMERDDIPNVYQELARYLKPIRADYPVALHHTHPDGATLTRENTARWFSRFD